MPDTVRFSKEMQKKYHIKSFHHRGRLVAVLLTCGEVVVAFLLLKNLDFLGCYTMASYLTKELLLKAHGE